MATGDPVQAEPPEPPRLRLLRRLVTTLTLVLIAGIIIVVGLLVIRLTATPAPLALPDAVALPAGERARAVTLGAGWVGVVTVDAEGVERFRIFERADGAERQVIRIETD